MRDDKPHGQWLVLQSLITLPPFGNTSEVIRVQAGVSRSGARTRLKELFDMGLVDREERVGCRHALWYITQRGWSILHSPDGVYRLRVMRLRHAVLEQRRAAELAPIKSYWQRRIKNEMDALSLGLIPDSVQPPGSPDRSGF